MDDNQIPANSEQKLNKPRWKKRRSKAEDLHWSDMDSLKEQGIKNKFGSLQVIAQSEQFILICLTMIFVASMIAWAWHFLAPSAWAWLDQGQLGKIQNTTFSGAIGAIISTKLQKLF